MRGSSSSARRTAISPPSRRPARSRRASRPSVARFPAAGGVRGDAAPSPGFRRSSCGCGCATTCASRPTSTSGSARPASRPIRRSPTTTACTRRSSRRRRGQPFAEVREQIRSQPAPAQRARSPPGSRPEATDGDCRSLRRQQVTGLGRPQSAYDSRVSHGDADDQTPHFAPLAPARASAAGPGTEAGGAGSLVRLFASGCCWSLITLTTALALRLGWLWCLARPEDIAVDPDGYWRAARLLLRTGEWRWTFGAVRYPYWVRLPLAAALPGLPVAVPPTPRPARPWAYRHCSQPPCCPLLFITARRVHSDRAGLIAATDLGHLGAIDCRHDGLHAGGAAPSPASRGLCSASRPWPEHVFGLPIPGCAACCLGCAALAARCRCPSRPVASAFLFWVQASRSRGGGTVLPRCSRVPARGRSRPAPPPPSRMPASDPHREPWRHHGGGVRQRRSGWRQPGGLGRNQDLWKVRWRRRGNSCRRGGDSSAPRVPVRRRLLENVVGRLEDVGLVRSLGPHLRRLAVHPVPDSGAVRRARAAAARRFDAGDVDCARCGAVGSGRARRARYRSPIEPFLIVLGSIVLAGARGATAVGAGRCRRRTCCSMAGAASDPGGARRISGFRCHVACRRTCPRYRPERRTARNTAATRTAPSVRARSASTGPAARPM